MGQAEHLLEEIRIDAEDSANSSVIHHFRVFLSMLIFQYNFYPKFTKLNLYLILILSCWGLSKGHKVACFEEKMNMVVSGRAWVAVSVRSLFSQSSPIKNASEGSWFSLFWWDVWGLKQTGLLTAGLAPLHHHSHLIFHLFLGSPWWQCSGRAYLWVR